MARKNHTLLTEFVLLGLADTPELQVTLFLLFLVMYTLTVLGNVGMILLIRVDARLHTPMYFFLAVLSCVDVSYSSTVTPKMRRMAWRKCYALAGVKGKGKLPKNLPTEAAKWRAIALTKKTRLHVRANIPKRQFIGESRELSEKINHIITESINRINNGINHL